MLGMLLFYVNSIREDKDTATKTTVVTMFEQRPEEVELSMIQPTRKSSTRSKRLFGCADANSLVASLPQPL